MNRLIEIKGDLLDFPKGINVIGHSANCQNTMGSGIALQIKNKMPYAYEADTNAAKRQENVLGNFSCAKVFEVPVDTYVFNLYTQQFFGAGRQVNYEAFYTSLERMRGWLKVYYKDAIVGFPKYISSDRAGGSWPVIKSMINDVFGKSQFKTYIVKYDGN